MLYRIFAAIGVPSSRRTRAHADFKTCRDALVTLSRPGVQLSAETIRVIRAYSTPLIDAEYERDLLKLENQYHKRRARVGLVICQETLGTPITSQESYLLDIAKEEGLHGPLPKRNSKPNPPEIPNNEQSQTYNEDQVSLAVGPRLLNGSSDNE